MDTVISDLPPSRPCPPGCHRDLAVEDSSNCEVSAMARIASSDHLLAIKHLLSKLGYCDSTVLLVATRREWSEISQEEV